MKLFLKALIVGVIFFIQSLTAMDEPIKEPKYRPVSSVYGEITKMLLTYPNQTTGEENITLQQRYKGIFKALGNNITYIILASQEVHESINNIALRCGLEPSKNLLLIPGTKEQPYVTEIIKSLSDGTYICRLASNWHTIWAQDGYIALKRRNDNTTVLMEPSDSFLRGGDFRVADQVAARSGGVIEHESTKYQIEGGNMLSGEDYMIVGVDFLVDNANKLSLSHPEITLGFQHEFGVSHLIWLGDLHKDFRKIMPEGVFPGTHQPIFHIDMYVTLAGKNEDKTKELVYVGDLNLAKQILGQELPNVSYAQAFDDVAEFLEKYEGGPSFEVKRIPLDIWKNPQDNQIYGLTYNNCLIEVFEDKKNVYLPSYASAEPGNRSYQKLDEAVEQIFSKDGFKVTMMGGAYHQLCMYGGSVHCITKDLERK